MDVKKCFRRAEIRRALAARQHGDAVFLRQITRRRLVAKHVQGFRARPHEGDTRLAAGIGEIGILTQETIAGMNGVAVLFLGDGQDSRAIQISRHATARQGHGFVRLAQMQGCRFIPGIHRHRGDTQVSGGAQNANGDFAAIGDQQFLNTHDDGFPMLLYFAPYDKGGSAKCQSLAA